MAVLLRSLIKEQEKEQCLRNKKETHIRKWIADVLGLESQTGIDLCTWLSDGTVLCMLLKTLIPELKLKFHQNTKFPYKMIENIHIFLEKCKKQKILKDEYLYFSVSDIPSNTFTISTDINCILNRNLIYLINE